MYLRVQKLRTCRKLRFYEQILKLYKFILLKTCSYFLTPNSLCFTITNKKCNVCQ
ncbi:hypothetical protein LEP1GSC194_2588 [Leptospira alstonii serovar Sichuan str. 79601]|uniref:Uncharacterized protein n=1 Tax=Leptospira alstonii serovar Sichuan str. 79601 TaxID=1218565 RepID=M6DIC0_9LEPT|nr:hypothetical protein LEP1GSC194_2588 [Leptospira alstonii serovar Sichuan str. 79601]